MKTTVILNPASGRGHAGKLVPTIERALHGSGLDFDLLHSERPWHAAELAESAARRGVDVVLAAGGDGTVNETICIPSLLVSVMNGRRIGGGFRTAPNASPDDGLLDLCIAQKVSRPRMLTLLPHFLRGTQSTQPEIRMKQATQVRILAVKGVMPLQTDGEILSTACSEVTVQILPKQLEVIGVL